MKKMPVMVNAPSTNPMASGLAPKDRANKGSVGVRAKAKLSLAKKTMVHKVTKGEKGL